MPCAASTCGGARRVRRPGRAIGLRQVDAAARRLRLVPHFHGGEIGGELEVAGLDAARTGPPSSPRRSGSSRRSRRPRSSARRSGPRSSCRSSSAGARRRRARAPSRRSALALAIDGLLERTTDTLSGGELQRVALGGSARHQAAPRAARRADLAARPGGGRRADLAAAAAQRGVGGGGPARASTGSSAAWPPPIVWSPSSAGGSPSTALPAGFLAMGALSHDPGLDDSRGAAAGRGRALPVAASVREARRTLADRGVPRAVTASARRDRLAAGAADRPALAFPILGRAGGGGGVDRGPPGRRPRRRAR